MKADFHVTIHNRKIFTLSDTGVSKSVISEKCLQKIYCTDKVHPCTGIRLSSTSGSNISPIGILTLSIHLGTHKFKQNFMVCTNLRRPPRFPSQFHIQMGNFSFTEMGNLQNNSNLPLTIKNNSDHKICIPCNITIGTSETVDNLNYNINEITFAATSHTFSECQYN